MTISDLSIQNAVSTGELTISPFSLSQLQPASYEVRLADEIKWTEGEGITPHPEWLVDTKDPSTVTKLLTVRIPDSGLMVYPGAFLLGAIEEYIEIGPKFVGRVEGKSSLARIGLAVHVTAGFIDPGFKGVITLEMVNLSKVPILIYAGMKIAQLSFERVDGAVGRLYGDPTLGSHYQFQSGPTEAQIDGLTKRPTT